MLNSIAGSTIQECKRIPLAEFCIQELEYKPQRGKDSRLWRSLVAPSGVKIITRSVPQPDGGYFFQSPDTGIAGNILTLLMKLHSYTFKQAVEALTGRSSLIIPKREVVEERRQQDTTSFVRRKFEEFLQKCGGGVNYLTRRGLTPETLKYFKVKAAPREAFFPLYFLEGEKYKAATAIRYFFTSWGERRRLFLKGCPKRGGYSLFTPQKQPPIHFGTLYLFESPVDALSYAQLSGTPPGLYMSFCGRFGWTFLRQLIALLQKNAVRRVVIAVDNDKQGEEYKRQLSKALGNLILKGRRLELSTATPQGKDWNEDLNSEGA